jgi:hypothetical protein
MFIGIGGLKNIPPGASFFKKEKRFQNLRTTPLSGEYTKRDLSMFLELNRNNCFYKLP